MAEKDELKIRKKLAKAEAKAAKKGASSPDETEQAISAARGKTPAERSAEAAERQLRLHRWKVAFAAISALVALATLILLLLKG